MNARSFASATVLAAVVCASHGAYAPSAAAAIVQPTPVVVIGSSDLRWGTVGAVSTPALWPLVSSSATGSLSIKAAGARTCPDDGWLTLGAGNRAAWPGQHESRCEPGPPSVEVAAHGAGVDVAGFAAARRSNLNSNDAAAPGALADALAAAGQCVAAAGAPAALGAADRTGHVTHYAADPVVAARDPAFLDECTVTLIAATPSDLSALITGVETALPEAALLVVGLADTGGRAAHLHVALAHGGKFGPGPLVSASTRRAPFVQLIDVAPTILSLRGLDRPASMIGQPWRAASTARTANTAAKAGKAGAADTAARVRRLADLDLAAQRQAGAIVPFYLTLVGLLLVACGLAWVVGRPSAGGSPGHARARLTVAATVACTFAALLPAASFLAGLVRWWRTPHPLAVLLGVVAAFALALTAGAVALDTVVWRRRPFGLAAAIGWITAGVIGADLVTGGGLQIFTMAGYSPLVAGRFAGIGNVAFGLFAAAALLAAGGAADLAGPRRAGPRRAGLAALAVGAVAVAFDGAPAWGSDVGGVLALVPAVAVLAWLVAGVRVSWRRAVLALAAAIAAAIGLGTVDYLRPPDHQTHLGRFVGDVLHGRAWVTLHRKAASDLALLGHSALTLLVPLLVVAAGWLVARPGWRLRLAFGAAPVLRPTLVAVLVAAVVGAVVNDSGVAIPALAVLVALPAVVTTVTRGSTRAPNASTSEPPAGLLR